MNINTKQLPSLLLVVGLLFLSSCLKETAIPIASSIQAKSRGVDVLSVGVVAHDEDLGLTRVIDVEGEVIASHYPVECWGDHTREWDLCRGDLSL